VRGPGSSTRSVNCHSRLWNDKEGNPDGVPLSSYVVDHRNIKLILCYDGTHYHGWQRQKNAVTLQETVENQIHVITGETVSLTASGRTDAGVHALNQVCNFFTHTRIPPDSLQKGLNSLLPDDVFIKEATWAPPDFHARYSAKTKVYEYRILNRKAPDIFRRHYVWHIPRPLDIPAMKVCLSHLKGTHDFASFRSSGSGNTNPVRTISTSKLTTDGDGDIQIMVEADGFLRHMVRNIVGTVISAGFGKISADRFREILALKDRRLGGVKAPPQGLFLVDVVY